jgi:hypothetical protein
MFPNETRLPATLGGGTYVDSGFQGVASWK